MKNSLNLKLLRWLFMMMWSREQSKMVRKISEVLIVLASKSFNKKGQKMKLC